MLSCKPIDQQIIESMINRHIKSYYKIGDLYNFTMRSYPYYNNNIVSTMLECNIVFNYEGYVEICKYGKSLPQRRYIQDSKGKYIKPYDIVLSCTHLHDNKKHVIDVRMDLCDPVSVKQTMNGKIIEFLKKCQTTIKKFEDK